MNINTHLPRKDSHDGERSDIERYTSIRLKLRSVHLRAASDNIARTTARLDNDCR